MDSSVEKIAYVGTIDSFIRKTYRYDYMGRNIQSIKPSIGSLLGADFSYYIQNDVHYQIWDIEPDEKFDLVKCSYYRGCTAGIVLFSLHDVENIQKLSSIVEEIWENNGSGFIPISFVGIRNIYSRPDEQVINEYNNQIRILTSKYDIQNLNLAYFESSIQYGENTREIFSFFKYLHNHSNLKNRKRTNLSIKKPSVMIIESNKDIIDYSVDNNVNSKLLFAEKTIIHVKCIADRSIIQLKDENDDHCCNTCQNLFCFECFGFYKENPDLDCPGTTSNMNIHKPLFD